jgi:hypothetical protein
MYLLLKLDPAFPSCSRSFLGHPLFCHDSRPLSNSLRMNSFKTDTKQTTLTSFKMNVFRNTRGRVPPHRPQVPRFHNCLPRAHCAKGRLLTLLVSPLKSMFSGPTKSVHSTRLTTPLESAFTRFTPPNPFRIRVYKNHGGGGTPSIILSPLSGLKLALAVSSAPEEQHV